MIRSLGTALLAQFRRGRQALIDAVSALLSLAALVVAMVERLDWS